MNVKKVILFLEKHPCLLIWVNEDQSPSNLQYLYNLKVSLRVILHPIFYKLGFFVISRGLISITG